MISTECVVLEEPLLVRLWISQPMFVSKYWLWTVSYRNSDKSGSEYKHQGGWTCSEQQAREASFEVIRNSLRVSEEECQRLLADYQERLALSALSRI